MTMSKFNNRGNTRHGSHAVPGGRQLASTKTKQAALELDEEGDMPTLRMLPACKAHTIHPPCGSCGDCTGAEPKRGWSDELKAFECLACRIFKLMGWNGSSAST